MTWLSILCPSCRPHDLKKWLDSLHANCANPENIELSLTLEHELDPAEKERWGNVVVTMVKHGEYNINQLHEICYKQSTSPFIMFSGDDTICHTKNWDIIFIAELAKYPDNVVLVYPNDTIFKEALACYAVTSRLVMDHMPCPVPFERYAIDDTLFNIVPEVRRIYLRHVVFEHMHLVDHPPGSPVIKDGKMMYYPHDVEAMQRDRVKYQAMEPIRNKIRSRLEELAGLTVTGKIMICVPTAEFARRADFYDYFNALDKPNGTMITFSHGQSPARNRNIMIRLALQNNATHILFLDDDMSFKPDLLKRLLSHNLDIVSGLYVMRNYPHLPVMFDEKMNDGKCKFKFLRPDVRGVVEVVNIGLGACLIKTDVFRQMCGDNDPEKFCWITLGEAEADHWSDDISFFNRVSKMGIKMHVDTDARCGHVITAIITPEFDEDKGGWFTTYNTASPEMFQVPQRTPTKEEVERQIQQEGYVRHGN